MNIMQQPRIEKLTLNIGAGKDQNKLEKGIAVLKLITGIEPVKTITIKRIPTWGLRPGLPVGCKITLRKTQAAEVLKRLLHAREHKLAERNFDDSGNISFGVLEHIDIPGISYDPKIGVMGLQACVTLEKPGYRIKKRKLFQKKIPPKHTITKEEAISFMKSTFNVHVGDSQ